MEPAQRGIGAKGHRWYDWALIDIPGDVARGRQSLPTGLDEHQVRRWSSWHRWTVLALLAHAFLAVMTATARAETPPPHDLIALTANEIRHLFTRLVNDTQHSIQHLLHWSRWRRRHQAHARECHYRRQAIQLA